MLPVHQKIFYLTIEEHIEKQKYVRHLETWISTWSLLIHYSVQREKTLGFSRRRPIDNYYVLKE